MQLANEWNNSIYAKANMWNFNNAHQKINKI